MKSERFIQHRTYKRWVPPYWKGPTTTAPTEDLPRYQTWTNDLLLSGGNHGYEARKGFVGEGSDKGGPFLVHKRDYKENILNSGGDAHFSWFTDPSVEDSPYFLTNQWPWKDEFNEAHFPVPQPSSDQELQALGTSAIARVKPTKPSADLATFLGELREGLPHAVGLSRTGRDRARQSRNAGDEYLNVEFGWKPLLRDVNTFLDTYRNSEEILRKYREGAGKLIKRRYQWPTSLTVEEEFLGNRYPVPLLHPWNYNPTVGGPLALTLVKTEKVERWFSAAFVYDVPSDNGMFKHINEADKLWGVKPTPEVLWNLAPWSWAADWVANSGDVISNMSSFATDGLVLHHAYVMEHKTNTYEYKMEVPEYYWNSHPAARILSQTFIGETKKRVGATPYGFGVSWDDLSGRQLAILASLGISRAK